MGRPMSWRGAASATVCRQQARCAKFHMIKLAAVKPAGFGPLQASRRFSRRVATMASKRVLVPIGRGSEEMEAVSSLPRSGAGGAQTAAAAAAAWGRGNSATR